MAEMDTDEVIDLTLEYDEIGARDESDEQSPDGEPMDNEMLSNVLGQLRSDLEDAEDLFQSDFEAEREKAQKYYNGEVDLPVAGENRSHFVNTKVRDTIRALKPDIMRLLCGTQHPVSYIPTTVEAAPLAEQQTEYVTQLFHRMGGYKLVYDAAHTACLHKLGVAKVWHDQRKCPQYASYTGIDEQQLQLLQNNPDLTVIIDSETVKTIPGPEGLVESPVYDVDVVAFETKGKTIMQSIPIEDFIIDEYATDAKSFKIIGHRRNITVSDAVSMGFDEDQVKNLDAQDPERYDSVGLSEQRRGYQLRHDDQTSSDPSQDKFLLSEMYYWADLDELGVAQLYRFWLGGTSYKYLDHERVDDHPFALFMIDPEPYTVFGHSIYDVVHQDQDVTTSLGRAVIDNAHQTNNPRLAVHETLVNMEDVLNNEIGAPIRNRAAGNIQVISTPFTGGQLMPLMQYLDENVDNKVGISRASVGLDPSAMQSTDKDAVRNTIAKQAGQVELAVRNLAESGMKRLFSLLLKTTLENPQPTKVMKVTGGYIPAPLNAFDADMDMEVNVGIGNATYDQRMMGLERVLQMQEKIMGQLGPGNPVVGLQQIMNAMQDALETMGMHHVQRYFNPVTPEVEQQIAQQIAQAQQQQQPPPDPSQAIVEAEQIKAQTQMQIAQGKGQIDMQKAAQKNQLDMAKAAADNQLKTQQMQLQAGFDMADARRADDLARDQMMQDLFVKMAELEAKLGGQVETAQIAATVQRGQNATGPGTSQGGPQV